MTTVALGYEELARRLGITMNSVRRTVNRHRWRKVRGNNGRTLIHVPEEYLARRDAERGASETATGTAPEAVHEIATETVPVAELIEQLAALQAEMAALAQRLATAEGRAGTAEAKAEGLEAVLAVERRQASELRAERDRLTARIDAAQDRHIAELMALHERMAKAEHDRTRAVDALAAHMALPWWRRLFA
jgi:chromosome segregation ATPase